MMTACGSVRISLAAVAAGGALAPTWQPALAQSHQHGEHVVATQEQPPSSSSSALKALRKRFEELASSSPKGRHPAKKVTSEAFMEFLAWPGNPLTVQLTVRLTFPGGVGPAIGSLTIKNGQIMVADRKEGALLIQPDVRGLPPGRYAFHVHENADCGSAEKAGRQVPGLAAGEHLWAKGTGVLGGTTFSSHLGNLTNLQVDSDGTARTVVVATRLTLADVAGRSFMIHASPDDASERLACAAFD